jgi:plastocyanin
MTAIRALCVVAGLSAIVLAGAARAENVDIKNFAFAPTEITVKAGSRIVFVNRDQVPHSVIGATGKAELFRSPEQVDEDEDYSVVLSEPGSIDVRCGLHSHMRGVIKVAP